MMPIVDPHVQLSGCENQLSDYLDQSAAFHVLRLVVVQQPSSTENAQQEIRDCHKLSKTRGFGGFPNAIVAYCDIAKTDSLNVLLEQKLDANIRGVHVVPSHRTRGNDTVNGATANGATSQDNKDSIARRLKPVNLVPWLPALEWLQAQGMSVDLTITVEQCKLVEEIATRYPSLTVVVNVQNWWAELASNHAEQHQACIGLLAGHDNVHLKLCGCGVGKNSRYMQDVVERSVNAFGYARVMFASGSKDTSIAQSFDAQWRGFVDATSVFSARQREKIFRTNAINVYQL